MVLLGNAFDNNLPIPAKEKPFTIAVEIFFPTVSFNVFERTASPMFLIVIAPITISTVSMSISEIKSFTPSQTFFQSISCMVVFMVVQIP